MESLILICFCTKENSDSKQMSNEIYETSGLLMEGCKDSGDGGVKTEFEFRLGYIVTPCLKRNTEYKDIKTVHGVRA